MITAYIGIRFGYIQHWFDAGPAAFLCSAALAAAEIMAELHLLGRALGLV